MLSNEEYQTFFTPAYYLVSNMDYQKPEVKIGLHYSRCDMHLFDKSEVLVR